MEPDRGIRRAQSMGISPPFGGKRVPGEALLRHPVGKWNEHVCCSRVTVPVKAVCPPWLKPGGKGAVDLHTLSTIPDALQLD